MKRLAGLPPKGKRIADWYMTGQPIMHTCPVGGEAHEDYPDVLESILQFDHGGIQRRKHLGWDETGWVALCKYPHGGILGWSGEYEVVTGEQVAKWGRELGSWERQ